MLPFDLEQYRRVMGSLGLVGTQLACKKHVLQLGANCTAEITTVCKCYVFRCGGM